MKKIIILAVALLLFGCGQQEKKTALKFYCGAGLRKAVDTLVGEFEKNNPVKIEMDYAGSGVIIARAMENKDGDLFMPGSVSYVNKLQEKAGIVKAQKTIAYFVPTIITQKGNPKKILTLQDFARKDIKVALGQPKTCAVGKLTAKVFKNNGLDSSSFDAKESLTVNELAVWVKMKDVDAAIVWDAIANNVIKDIEEVKIPLKENTISAVALAVLSTTKNETLSKKFMNFVASPEGQKILKEKGYRIDAP